MSEMSESAPSRLRILLADDHRLVIEGIGNLLAAHGMEVVGIANDGLEAVAMAQQLSPDLILMDIRMPRCDGLSHPDDQGCAARDPDRDADHLYRRPGFVRSG
jgi:PleD family two-component response regulator